MAQMLPLLRARISFQAMGKERSAFHSSAVKLFLKPPRVQRAQVGILLRKPDQVQFVLLAFAEAPAWIAVGPELALGDILQASDSHMSPQNHGFDGPRQESLVSRVGGELNPKFASWRL